MLLSIIIKFSRLARSLGIKLISGTTAADSLAPSPKSLIPPLHSDSALIKSAAAMDSSGEMVLPAAAARAALLIVALAMEGAETEEDMSELGLSCP